VPAFSGAKKSGATLGRLDLNMNMKLGFDIFRRLDDGSPLWVAQANSIAEARTRLAALRQDCPGRYFVRDAEPANPLRLREAKIPGET